MTSLDGGADPRLSRIVEEPVLIVDDQEPVVGRAATGKNALLVVSLFALLAILLFTWLNARRESHQAQLLTTPVSTGSEMALAPAADLQLANYGPVANTGVGMVPPPPPFNIPNATPTPVYAATSAAGAGVPAFAVAVDQTQRRRAPAVVVDLGQAGERPSLAQNGGPGGAGLASGGAGAPGGAAGADGPPRPKLNDDEQFAERVGDEQPERARATTLRNLGALVPQGAVIPGVLETAINSDLPGYTRALVSRDVLSFDGKSVLIPRGSRIIGQYKSAVALGQSRAFVIWTRIIRPDGVSVQIGSPGTDALGRGGLEGDVDRHFFRRFGGSILLSVLNAGVSAVSATPSTQISIGSPGAAIGAASQAVQGENISPTIKVAQGEAIRIFVARDLDFSGVGPTR